MRNFIAGMVTMGCLFSVYGWADSQGSPVVISRDTRDTNDAAKYVMDALGRVRVGVLAAGRKDEGGTEILRVDDRGRVICSDSVD